MHREPLQDAGQFGWGVGARRHDPDQRAKEVDDHDAGVRPFHFLR